MKTIFYHGDHFTIALDLPDGLTSHTFNAFEYQSGSNEPVSFNIGLAKCHPKDQFCRAKGREVALSRQSEVEFKVCYLSFNYLNPYTGAAIILPVELKLAGVMPNGDGLILILGFKGHFAFIELVVFVDDLDKKIFPKVFPENADKGNIGGHL